jgi:hypothetical protein
MNTILKSLPEIGCIICGITLHVATGRETGLCDFCLDSQTFSLQPGRGNTQMHSLCLEPGV